VLKLAKNIKIANKLQFGFALVIVGQAIAGITTLLNLNTIDRSSAETEFTHTVLSELDTILYAMVEQEAGLRGYLAVGDRDLLGPYRDGYRRYVDSARRARALLDGRNPEQVARLDRIDRQVTAWREDVADKEIRLRSASETVEAALAMEAGGAGKTLMLQIRALVDEVKAIELAFLDQRAAAMDAAIQISRRALVVGTLVGLGLAISVGMLLSIIIGRRIVGLTGLVSRVADGDLNVAVDDADTRDEVGEMARAVQILRDRSIEAEQLREEQERQRVAIAEEEKRKIEEEAEQKERERRAEQAQRAAFEEERRRTAQAMADELETSVLEIVAGLASAAEELHATAQSLSAGVSQTKGQTSAVGDASHQTLTSVQTVASAAEQLSISIQEISQQISDSAQVADEAAQTARQSSETVAQLTDASARVGAIVDLIRGVAEQTNLLALNATIEAARAGEAGKGFAVVANEVKSLAHQASKATEEIAQQIEDMRKVTESAAGSIQRISKVIGVINEKSSNVAASVKEQSASTQEISRSAHVASEKTQEVTGNITGLSAAAEDTRLC